MQLAGRLTVAQLPELLEACTEVSPGVAVELDLADLVSADAAGIEALQQLREGGVTLTSTPGYLQLRLDSHARNH